MSTIGIIAEFNPLHSGHKYLLKQAKQLGTVVCAISGNLVQRGDTAICEKRLRAKDALLNGADVVIEMPVLWSMSTAQNFALGGISALKAAGCDTVMFGSECGDTALLQKAAELLLTPEFSELLGIELKKGITFAKARQNVCEKLGLEAGLLEGANNNLAIEYIIAAKRLGYHPRFITVKRLGAAHDSLEEQDFVSASLLRERLKNRDYDFCRKYMSHSTVEEIAESGASDIKNIERLILGTLRTRSLTELKALPDISEGVENKLFSAIRLATSLEELYNEIKVKRYTLARIRRLVLSAFLGLDNEFFMKPLPYIRIIGFNDIGMQYIKTALSMKTEIPVITKVSDIKQLDASAQKVFETECKATDLYMLSFPQPKECGLEYTAKIIKTEC